MKLALRYIEQGFSILAHKADKQYTAIKGSPKPQGRSPEPQGFQRLSLFLKPHSRSFQ